MTTRAIYRFIDEHEKFSVYKHSKCSPQSTVKYIKNAMQYAFIQDFDAGDFAAVFVAANKVRAGGDIYLYSDPEEWGDIDYRYNIFFKDGFLRVRFMLPHQFMEGIKPRLHFEGPFEEFEKFSIRAKRFEMYE